jgi:hypothetical protein
VGTAFFVRWESYVVVSGGALYKFCDYSKIIFICSGYSLDIISHSSMQFTYVHTVSSNRYTLKSFKLFTVDQFKRLLWVVFGFLPANKVL